MEIVAAITAFLKVLPTLIDLFTKSPPERLQDIADSLIEYTSELRDGAQHLKENKGDTSKLEDAINKRRKK